MDLVEQDRRVEDENRAEGHKQDLRLQVEQREADIQGGRLAQTADVEQRQQRDCGCAPDDVAGVVVERRPERAQVVRDEER